MRARGAGTILVGVALFGLLDSVSPAGEAAAPRPAYLDRFQNDPASAIDKDIKALIVDAEARIEKLNSNDELVKTVVPRLRQYLTILYKEYNLSKAADRYRGDHFNAVECLNAVKSNLKRLDALEQGRNALDEWRGRILAGACWIDGIKIMGRYDLIVPRDYDPKKSWPIMFSFQDNPSDEQIRTVPYFLVRCVQKGYPKGMVELEFKTRCILKDVAQDFNIDPFRIYGTGFSFGGHTGLRMAWRFPDLFAAIAPLCSDLRDASAPNVKFLVNTPALLLHGTHDDFLNPGKKVFEWMKEAGCNVQFQTYEGGHDPAPFRNNVKLIADFFDQHKLNPYPRRVTHAVEHKRYSRAFWVDAKFVKDAAMNASFDVRVEDGNQIRIEASEEVAELDFCLNDKLVDMQKPLTVLYSGKAVFEGAAAEKITVKLRDSQEYHREKTPPLWQEIEAIRKGEVK